MAEEITVLLVDDDTQFLDSVSVLLKREGITCITAPDGDTGLRIMREQRPSVAVVDLDMPIMNGIRFAEEVNEQEIDIPVIIVSGHSVLELPTTINTAGVSAFVQKPMRMKELAGAIRTALEKHRAARR